MQNISHPFDLPEIPFFLYLYNERLYKVILLLNMSTKKYSESMKNNFCKCLFPFISLNSNE